MKWIVDIGTWESGHSYEVSAPNKREVEEIASCFLKEVIEESEDEDIYIVQIKPKDGVGPVFDFMNGWLG